MKRYEVIGSSTRGIYADIFEAPDAETALKIGRVALQKISHRPILEVRVIPESHIETSTTLPYNGR